MILHWCKDILISALPVATLRLSIAVIPTLRASIRWTSHCCEDPWSSESHPWFSVAICCARYNHRNRDISGKNVHRHIWLNAQIALTWYGVDNTAFPIRAGHLRPFRSCISDQSAPSSLIGLACTTTELWSSVASLLLPWFGQRSRN